MSKQFLKKSTLMCSIVLGVVLAVGFLTLPPLKAAPDVGFTFTAVGDLGGTTNTDGVLAGIGAAGADFQLTLGDLSYGSIAPESAWCSYVQGKVGATFPFELVSGNHDMDAQPTGHINNFVQCLPDRIGNLSGTYGKEYYFDYQNLARVIFISPNLTLDGETYSYNNSTARQAWLANAIDGARSANIPWVIVGMHKNCITTGVKSCEIGTDLLNLLVSKKVDLILQGHDHNYQRSKQLALNANCTAIAAGGYNANCVADDGADGAYVKGNGAVLNIVGTGGQSLYASNPFDTEANYFARIVNPGAGDVARYGFLKVNVTATQMSAQFVGTSAGSTFTDAFTISESAAPTATSTPTRTNTSAPTNTATRTRTNTNAPTKTATPTRTKTSVPIKTATPTKTVVSAKTNTPTPTKAQVALIPRRAWWKYLSNGSNQGTAWYALNFDDSTWKTGQAELGYGDGGEKTILSYGGNPNAKYITAYFRKSFSVTNPAAYTRLFIRLIRDDGAVVYLNGVEIARSNLPAGTLSYTTLASSDVTGTAESAVNVINLNPSMLRAGKNVVAVRVHQVSPSSDDMSFDFALIAQ